jgi:hypothetical protein
VKEELFLTIVEWGLDKLGVEVMFKVDKAWGVPFRKSGQLFEVNL